jgi:hypothetical protein
MFAPSMEQRPTFANAYEQFFVQWDSSSHREVATMMNRLAVSTDREPATRPTAKASVRDFSTDYRTTGP